MRTTTDRMIVAIVAGLAMWSLKARAQESSKIPTPESAETSLSVATTPVAATVDVMLEGKLVAALTNTPGFIPHLHAGQTINLLFRAAGYQPRTVKYVVRASENSLDVNLTEQLDTAVPNPTPHPDPEVRRRVMVLELQPVGVDPHVVTTLPALIAKEIGQHPGYDIASADDVQQLLSTQQAKQRSGCTEDEACLEELTRKSNADLVVSGSVGKLGESYVLSLLLVDPKTMAGARRAFGTAQRLEDLPRIVTSVVGNMIQSSAPAPAFHLPKGKKLAFAVFDLKPTGLSPETAQNLTQVLSAEVRGVEGASVISREDISTMLKFSATKMELGCTDDGCMAEIGGALGVDRLITGDVGKLGNAFVISLRLLDVRRGSVENRATETYEGDEEQLLRAVRHAARSLLGLLQTGKGQVAVTASQTAATVFVDQEKRGQAPTLIKGLAAGKHEVRVEQPRFFDWQGSVYVDAAETTSVWAQLNERPQRWYQKWWVWSAGGVAVAGAVVAAIVATRPPSKTVDGTVTYR